MIKPIPRNGYDTDKGINNYLGTYESFFSDIADKYITLLELGVNRGGSLLMWRDYFENGKIVGLDMNKVSIDDPSGHIKCYEGLQEDTALLKRIATENAPDGFDIIIDDCAHIGKLAQASFQYLFDNHLKSGGIYVIEDWGTGYWDSWPDGHSYEQLQPEGDRIPSHDFGMVGFIKELVDECGMANITNPKFGTPPYRRSKFEIIYIFPGMVFVIKNTLDQLEDNA
jgi:hypothetical protein